MAFADKYALEKRAERVLRSLESDWIRITTTLRIWERGPDDAPRVRGYLADLDVLIRLSDGRRFFEPGEGASEGARKAWDAKAATTGKHHRVYIDCHEKQVLPLQDDDVKTLALLGGVRAGKTHFLAWWLFRQWVLRGSRGAYFWWVAPTLAEAKRGVRKLFTGEGSGKVPCFPPELVIYCPPKVITGNQTARLIDGSEVVFHHANGDGDNLKGDDVQAIAVDEITAIGDPMNYTIIRGRTLESGGPVAMGSTPKAGHWVRDRVILKASHSKEIRYVEVDAWTNPWVTVREIWRLVQEDAGLEEEVVENIIELPFEKQAAAAREVIDDPLVLREYFGSWEADSLMAYASFKIEDHTVTGAGRTAGDLGFKDVTGLAQQADYYWSECPEHDYVGGQDFNINPMTTVVAQVIRVGDRWGLLVTDEVQTRGTVDMHANKLDDRYPGLPLACDPTGCRGGTPVQQRTADAPTHHHYLRSRGYPAIACWVVRGQPRSPDVARSLLLVNWLFRQGRIQIHERCRELIRGLQVTEATAAGGVQKISGTRRASDIASACPDALRYLCWRIFGNEFREFLASKHEALEAA